MKLALIGNGAISRFVQAELAKQGMAPAALILRRERTSPFPTVSSVAELSVDITHVVDCAGHEGLRQHGAAALRSGRDVITVSTGALADPALEAELKEAAAEGKSHLHLACGAIGALDALNAATVGPLTSVSYTGRKPPRGWMGSAADEVLDLANMGPEPATHFRGTAREAALKYPKNANVAAAVALAGPGFEATTVELIADPSAEGNVHEIRAEGAFGSFFFTITGETLPENPRTSALAAMSVVSSLRAEESWITIGAGAGA